MRKEKMKERKRLYEPPSLISISQFKKGKVGKKAISPLFHHQYKGSLPSELQGGVIHSHFLGESFD